MRKHGTLQAFWSACLNKAQGNSTILTLGMLMTTLVTAPVVVDIPTYLSVHQQLQNAVDAAALAGAANLPYGQTQAQQAALAMAQNNKVNGKVLPSSALTYSYSGNQMTVHASTQVNTVTAGLMCAMQFTTNSNNNNTTTGNTVQVNTTTCNSMKIAAAASAQPAARDTILVVDTSSSMGVTSNNQTLLSMVQQSATQFVNTVAGLNNNASVDRIGLVHFDAASSVISHLTSTTDSPNFTTVRSGISSLKLYNGSYWNTNYSLGLKTALDEMQANARPLANKQIIFMTDGNDNLPGPPADVAYNAQGPYLACTDPVNNSVAVQALCVTQGTGRNAYRVCPTLPSSQITDAMISSSAVQCGQTYTNYMVSQAQAQITRAQQMGVVITTIRVYNLSQYDSSIEIMQRLLKNPTWDPGLLNTMATTTGGEQYSAQYYDQTGIAAIYSQLATKLRIKLSG